jgi:geranylgeranylglycerol-phosphate geranylgeranyltransferase
VPTSRGEAKGMKKIVALFKLMRPQNDAIVALSVLVGATVSGEIGSWAKVLLACASAFFISAGGNSINDFFDLKIDRINKPDRPLPKGAISPPWALLFSVALFLLGMALSLWVGGLGILVAFGASGLLIVYSWLLKKRFLWGNLTVSLVCALAFVYGGLATNDFRLSLVPAAFALVFHLGREVLKDIEDRRGDLASGASTVPIQLGVNFSLWLCTLVFGFLVILTLFPYILDIFSWLYLLVAIPGVDLVVIYVIWSMWHDRSRSNLHRLSNLLKADMLVGLAAIYAGKF